MKFWYRLSKYSVLMKGLRGKSILEFKCSSYSEEIVRAATAGDEEPINGRGGCTKGKGAHGG